jgi:predicted PurR-regulated permease PerM
VSDRYQVPIGVEIATQWAWRILVIALAGGIGIWLLRYFSEITVPIAIAVLGTALTVDAVDWLDKRGLPRVAATFIVVIAMLVAFFGMLALVGQQLSTQVAELRSSVVDGISQVQDWAKTGPLQLSDSQVQDWVDNVKESISSSDTSVVARLAEVGTTLTHVLAGFFIALFSAFFFLYEGQRIWSWIVALFPAGARARVDSSGHTAWASLTAFVHATVIVALTDAIGIALGAWVLNVPLTFAIGVLVFLLIVVIVIQQIESHVLQPFLMGRLVAVHPLAIIFAIAAGVTVAGVVGALIAVPLAACLNGVVRHLVSVAQDYQDDPEGDVGPGTDPEPA